MDVSPGKAVMEMDPVRQTMGPTEPPRVKGSSLSQSHAENSSAFFAFHGLPAAKTLSVAEKAFI
ncbi:hypothetical protein ACTL6U_17375 [Rhodovibrionaceae bacterium A322]